MEFNSLQDVFAEQLNDLRSAEEQLVQVLPRMAGAAVRRLSNRRLHRANRYRRT